MPDCNNTILYILKFSSRNKFTDELINFFEKSMLQQHNKHRIIFVKTAWQFSLLQWLLDQSSTFPGRTSDRQNTFTSHLYFSSQAI